MAPFSNALRVSLLQKGDQSFLEDRWLEEGQLPELYSSFQGKVPPGLMPN
jgi:hypothetical protein